MISNRAPARVTGNLCPNASIVTFYELHIVGICDMRSLCFLIFFSANRTVEVPSSRIVIIEGIYALSEKLRPLLDLRVSVTGGVHFDLVKRVLRDIQRAGQEPEEIIHQISETVIFHFFCSFC